MSTTAKASSADVKAFLKEIVEFGDAYIVDEQSYVIAKVKNEKVPFKGPDGTTKFLTIYDPMQQNTDVLVFNPFVEGLDETLDKQWFYMSKSLSLAGITYRIMEAIIKHVISAKDKKSTEDLGTGMASLIANYVSMDGIDTKLLLELDIIVKNMGKFFNIFYSRKDNSSCRLNVGIFEENFRNSFGSKVRKRSWTVFEKIMGDILGTTNPKEEFKHLAQVAGCPHLDSYMRTYTHILKKMKKYWHLQNKTVNLKSLEKHTENLGLYYNIARHYAGPAARTNTTPGACATPPAPATPPWQTPQSPAFPGLTNQPGMPFSPANATYSPAADPNMVPMAQHIPVQAPQHQQVYPNQMPMMPTMPPQQAQLPANPGGYMPAQNPQYAQMPFAPMQQTVPMQPMMAPMQQYPQQPMMGYPQQQPQMYPGYGQPQQQMYPQHYPQQYPQQQQMYPGYPQQQQPQQPQHPQMMMPTNSGIMIESPMEVHRVVANSPLI